MVPDGVGLDTDEPEREIACGELDALSVRVTTATMDPMLTGAN